ncbi:MAG: Gfo/Idh/MocA family protein [Planctomycetota bacterium]|jgi:predicted dehydrogenase
MLEIAVLGAGHWGPNLIRSFNDERRSNVRWIVDTDPQRLETSASRFPGVMVTTDPQRVFTDECVDAVVIATPTASHAELVRAALEAGKHVMVEKPLSHDTKSSAELSDLAADKGLVLLVGHIFLFNPAVQWVKQVLDSGDLGRTYYISSNRTNLGPIRGDVSAAWDLASQDIAIFNYWMGSAPLSVSAVGHAWLNEGIPDAVFATIRYPGSTLANLHVSWLNPDKVRQITVVADNKMLTYDDMNSTEPIRLYDKKVTDAQGEAFIDTFAGFRSVVQTGDITIPPVRMGEPLQAECANFIDCIEEKKAPISGGPEGLAVVRVLEAMDRSMAEMGREVEI